MLKWLFSKLHLSPKVKVEKPLFADLRYKCVGDDRLGKKAVEFESINKDMDQTVDDIKALSTDILLKLETQVNALTKRTLTVKKTSSKTRH